MAVRSSTAKTMPATAADRRVRQKAAVSRVGAGVVVTRPASGLPVDLSSTPGGHAGSGRQRTTTRLPIGIRSLAQIMLMAALLSRAQPCESGHGGMFCEPCTAMPRWKKRGRQSWPSELVTGPSTAR